MRLLAPAPLCADDGARLVAWLEQVSSEDGFEPGNDDQPLRLEQDSGEIEFLESPDAEGEELGYPHSRWPDVDRLHGFYGVDQAALDHGQTPPYCRGCARPGCGPFGCDSCGGGCIAPTWFASADFLAFKRASSERVNLTGVTQTVVINGQNVTLSTVDMSTRDLDFNFQPGARLSIGRYLGTDYFKRVHSIEFDFFGFLNFAADHSYTGPDETFFDPFTGQPLLRVGALRSFFNPDVAGFSGATFQSAEYSSTLISYEVNYRVRRSLRRDSLVAMPDGTWQRRCTPGFTPSFLFGLRYVSVSEDFGFHSLGPRIFFGPNGQIISQQTARGDYLIRTTNDLFGFQVGGDLVQQYCRFNIGIRGKAGYYANWATETSVVSTSDPLPLQNPSRAVADKGQHSSFLGEFGFVGNWHFRPNMNLRAAYDFMWITSLANAPIQIQATTNGNGKLNHSGTTFFQGPSAGLEIFW
jgi:hypothetical protein